MDMADTQMNGRPFIGQHPRAEKGGSWDESSPAANQGQQYRDADRDYYSDGQGREADPRYRDPDQREQRSERRYRHSESEPRIDRYGREGEQVDPRSERRYREAEDMKPERRYRDEQDPHGERARYSDQEQVPRSEPRSERRHREGEQDPRARDERYYRDAEQDQRRPRRSPQPPRRNQGQQPRRSPQAPRGQQDRRQAPRPEPRRRSGPSSNNDHPVTDQWSSGNSTESQQHQLEADCKVFMTDLVYRIFNQSETISQDDNAAFGTFCRYSTGRQWFAKLVDAERVNSQKVSEQTFYRLVQFFAVCLFECNEADDFTPAKSLMNMCFTFSHEHEGVPVSSETVTKSFLYTHLTEQPIWKSLRFWNASFFDAVHTERKQRCPDDRGNWRHQTKEEQASTETQDENITFGQLATFLHNMMELGLSRDTVVAFLDKQAIIGNLSPDQTELLNGNVVQYFREKRFQEQNQKRHEQNQRQPQRNQIQRPQTLQKTQQIQSRYPPLHDQPPYESAVTKFGRYMKYQLNSLSSTR